MKKLVTYFLEKSLLVNLISIGLILMGAMFLLSANREAFPKVEYDFLIINTLYPGATPEDIEKHISIPIEDQLREVDGIDEIWSSSLESRSIIGIKLNPDLKNKLKVITDIKDSVDAVSDLPDDAEDPTVVELNSSLVPVLEISMTNKFGIKNDSDERDLRKKVKMLRDKLLVVDGVARIEKSGYRDREIHIAANPILLNKYHVAMNDIIRALSSKNLNFPGGLITTAKEDVMIRTIGEVQNTDDIKKVLIRANDSGNWITVNNIGVVKNTFEEELLINKTNGKKSIILTVLIKEGADIITVVDNINLEINKFKSKKINKNFPISYSNDFSFFVKRRLNVLKNNAVVGLVLVILSLLISLGWRISLVTAVGIPLAFAGTFIWMGQAGISINLISMFGLIIVLGMVVDDAIVVAENVYRHLEEGFPLKEAVIIGTSEVIVPVAGTILTTIAAFSPLMFMTGIMGKFMWTMPAVISITLFASWVESMFILPAHIYDIEKFRKKSISKHRENKPGIYVKIKNKYVKMLTFVLNNKYKFALMITLIFFGSIYFAKNHIQRKLFPQGKIERLVIKMEASNGTSLNQMNHKMVLMEKIISKMPPKEVDNFVTRVGIIKERPLDPNEKRGTNYGTINLNLTPEEDRNRKAAEIIVSLREKSKTISKAFTSIKFTYISTGPPTGKAISVNIKGDDFTVLKEIAEKYKKYMRSIKIKKKKKSIWNRLSNIWSGKNVKVKNPEKSINALKDINDDFEKGKKEFRIYVDEKVAAIAGVSVYDVALTVRSCFKGTVATTIKKTDEEIDIRVLFPENLRNKLSTINKIYVANKMGNLIPLRKIAKFDFTKRGISVINRRGWKRSIQVTAEIDETSKDAKLTSVEVNKRLIKRFKNIEDQYPGVIIDYEGEFKDTNESMINLVKSFLFAILIIYIILVAIFQSMSHPLIIMGVIPLTGVGVIWIFFLHQMPLSFLALMGVVGLAGVVVNDSIVLVDFIKNARIKGMNAFDATVLAGGNRLRPVFLTTITTFFGLIPTAYGIGGLDPFLVPMAISMSWGLAFGTLITLFATPILYNIFADARTHIFKKSEGFDSSSSPDLSDINKLVKNEELLIKNTLPEEKIKTKSYYKTIKGEKYDRMVLETTESLISGRGDGRISLTDAKQIFIHVKDGTYTETEKRTVKYILKNFKFTDSAKIWFKREVKKLGKKG
jgi:multidrug efflux pump subunit AcrB